MTAFLAIVRSTDEAVAAAEAGAGAVAIAIGSGPVQAPSRRLARCGPMITGARPDPLVAVAEAADAGFDQVWLPLDPGSLSAIEHAAARDLAVVVTVPLGQPLDGTLCDEALAVGAPDLLVAGAPFGAARVIDVHPTATLAGFLSSARARGVRVGFAGGIEAPDVPRLLALRPDVIGLDTLLLDAADRFAPERLRAALPLFGPAPPLPPQAKGGPDRIFIRDWMRTMSIGAYASEKAAAQRVRFTVEADLAPASAEGMAGVVSYDLITDAIERLAAGHHDFVETVAEGIASDVLAHPRVLTVCVTVEKLDRGPGTVGCRIVRRRGR